jgi:hypothetical protein
MDAYIWFSNNNDNQRIIRIYTYIYTHRFSIFIFNGKPQTLCGCHRCRQVFDSTLKAALHSNAIDDRNDAIVGRKRLSWRDQDLDEWKGLDEE